MSFADSFVRAPMAGATDIRIIKRRIRDRKPIGTQALEWVSDEVMGGSDVTDDRTPKPRITELQWAAPDGRSHAVALPADVEFDDHDVADLLAYGRAYSIGVAVWCESAALDRTMQLEQSWFRQQPFAEPHTEVQVAVDGGATTITTERPPPGGLGRAWGAVFKTTGAGIERWCVTISPSFVTFHHVTSRGETTAHEWPRADVIALGHGVRVGSGTMVFVTGGGVELPSIRQEGRMGDATSRMQTAVHAANVALGAS